MTLQAQVSEQSPRKADLEQIRKALKSRWIPPIPVTIFFILILIPLHFNIGSLFMTGTRVLLLVIFIPMYLRLVTGQLGRILLTDILFQVFAIWNIFTLFLNTPDQAVSFGGSVALEVLGGYLLGRTYVRTAEDFARMCLALFWTIIFTLPFAAYESQTGVALIPELIRKLPFFDSVPDFYNDVAGRRLGLERAQVIFAHPIHYGLFCSTAFALALVGFKRISPNVWRIFFAGSAITGVFFSVSSGAILPLAFQIGLIAWAWVMTSVRQRWIILGVLVTLAYVAVDMISNRSPITVFLSYATLDAHTASWRQIIFEWGMKNVWANPIFGIGMNDWERPWFMRSGSLDNYWLLTTVRYGIPAFIMVAAGFATAIVRVALSTFDADGPTWQFRRAWTITLVSLIITLATVDVWATAQAYVFFIFGSGMWLLSAPHTPVADPKKPMGALESLKHGARATPPFLPQRGGSIYSRFDPTHKRVDSRQK